MIICVCNSLREKELRKVCADSCDKKSMCANKIMDALGCKPRCGKCLCYIDDIASQEVHSAL